MTQRDIVWGLIALGVFFLIDSREPVLAQSSQVATSISANQKTFKPGDTLTITGGVTNSGIASSADFYFGALLPDGNTIVNFTDPQLDVAIGSLSQVAALHPIMAGVTLPGSFSVTNVNLFSYRWSGTEPLGRYVFFLAAAQSGAPLVGSLLALSVAEFTFESLPASPARPDLQFDGFTNYVEVSASSDLSVSPSGGLSGRFVCGTAR